MWVLTSWPTQPFSNPSAQLPPSLRLETQWTLDAKRSVDLFWIIPIAQQLGGPHSDSQRSTWVVWEFWFLASRWMGSMITWQRIWRPLLRSIYELFYEFWLSPNMINQATLSWPQQPSFSNLLLPLLPSSQRPKRLSRPRMRMQKWENTGQKKSFQRAWTKNKAHWTWTALSALELEI